MSFEFDGKVCIVTGGTLGIGHAVAERLLQQGASVVISSRDAAKGDEVVSSLTKAQSLPYSRLSFFRADICNPAEVRSLFAYTLERHGKCDIVVANAGFMASKSFTEELDEGTDDWMNVIQGNVIGTLLLAKLAIANWHKHKIPGVVVLSSSLSGVYPNQIPHHCVAYPVAKAALCQFVPTIAMTLDRLAKRQGLSTSPIRVTALLPGFVWTAMWNKMGRGAASDTAPSDLENRSNSAWSVLAKAVGWTPMSKIVDAYITAVTDPTTSGKCYMVMGTAGPMVPYPDPRITPTYEKALEAMVGVSGGGGSAVKGRGKARRGKGKL
ncbi:NAD(P)-binding protein [Gonapodya prolifera JEL478]|uniref:NAD(P)-binding protein n=1 Tax=Gonapodya prolifera (strain JEL478) TaxID=1344416 RepID=A0A139AKJ3_GONPJ|nr:NAD(P)-binding protein [Gonapodya prolifera JEL478]|eukprot:KXS17311.1 NAD(P)-binding protein [Gonapodya prolifera JEL478]